MNIRIVESKFDDVYTASATIRNDSSRNALYVVGLGECVQSTIWMHHRIRSFVTLQISQYTVWNSDPRHTTCVRTGGIHFLRVNPLECTTILAVNISTHYTQEFRVIYYKQISQHR